MSINNVLLVEGPDDKHVLLSLLTHYKLPENFRIKEKGGINSLFNDLEGELLASGMQSLGIVVDADLDLTARWQSLRNVLSTSYLNIPVEPDINGTIVESNDLPKIGIWLMPDNKLPGMLEDFIAFLVPDQRNDPIWALSEKCLQEARASSPAIPQAKGRIHTYLAWQNEPSTPLGLAVTKKYLDANKPQAQQFVDWLRRLFT